MRDTDLRASSNIPASPLSARKCAVPRAQAQGLRANRTAPRPPRPPRPSSPPRPAPAAPTGGRRG